VFASPDDLASLLQTEFTSSDWVNAELVLNNATGRIRGWTGQTIAPVTPAVQRWRRAGYGRLFLPHPPAIPVEVTAVTVDGVPADVWDVDEFHSMPGWWGDVIVTYTHGFPEAPDDVRNVCLQLAARQATNPTTTQSIKIEGYSESFQTAANVSDDALLASLYRYRRLALA
jgi:hypothetical protein